MKTEPSPFYMANPDVLYRREAEGAILHNLDTDKAVALNAAGQLIWQVLARPCTAAAITTRLSDIYQETPADQIAQDVSAFLQALQPQGFVGVVVDEITRLPNMRVEGALAVVESTLAQALPGADTFHIYHGRSMLGVFRPGDHLIIEPAHVTDVHRGDVIVYQNRSQNSAPTDVVHRVVAVSPGGLATQGDNNRRPDAGLVTQATLLGRVTRVARAGQTRAVSVRRVSGGRWGLLQLRARRIWRQGCWAGEHLIRPAGRPAYRWLRESGLVARLWRPALIRLLLIDPQGALRVKIVHGRQTVAHWQPAIGRWQCRRPYDLILRRPEGGIPSQPGSII